MTTEPTVHDIEGLLATQEEPYTLTSMLLRWSTKLRAVLTSLDLPDAKEYDFLLSQHLDLLQARGNSRLRGILMMSLPSYYVQSCVDAHSMRDALDILKEIVMEAEIPVEDRTSEDIDRLARKSQALYDQYVSRSSAD